MQVGCEEQRFLIGIVVVCLAAVVCLVVCLLVARCLVMLHDIKEPRSCTVKVSFMHNWACCFGNLTLLETGWPVKAEELQARIVASN